jgi:hypothetical protein
VIQALRAGNGRSARCEIKEEVPERLHQDGVKFNAEDLSPALTRLEDSAVITRVQKHGVQFIVLNGLKQFDAVDQLAADIAAVIKQHRDEFESEDELRSWLDQDHVEYDAGTLAASSR